MLGEKNAFAPGLFSRAHGELLTVHLGCQVGDHAQLGGVFGAGDHMIEEGPLQLALPQAVEQMNHGHQLCVLEFLKPRFIGCALRLQPGLLAQAKAPCSELAIESCPMDGGAIVPKLCLVAAAERRGGNGRPIGTAGLADRRAHAVMKLDKMFVSRLGALEIFQGNPAGKPLAFGKADAAGQPVTAGDAIGEFGRVVPERLAGHPLANLPPALGIWPIGPRRVDKFDNAVISAPAHAPTCALVNQAGVALQFGRHGAQGVIHTVAPIGQRHAGLGEGHIAAAKSFGLT